MSIQKIGIRTEDKIYALETYYEYADFLWGEEGVACLHFVESDEKGLIVNATLPIKYVDETINDLIKDIIVVRDQIEEFIDGQSIGKFDYDKGINLGAVYETFVAEELKAHDHELYYYDRKKGAKLIIW